MNSDRSYPIVALGLNSASATFNSKPNWVEVVKINGRFFRVLILFAVWPDACDLSSQDASDYESIREADV